MACTRIHFLLVVCTFQLLTIIERQVFDFLGYMWAPILVNFFHIIFVIFGFFGAYQLSAKYIVTYSVWNVIFIGWNAFLVCFYLNVGVLDRESDLLNLGTGSYSWFLVNGYGCQATYSDNITAVDDPYRPRRPETVAGCLVDYSLVEVVHSAVQCILAVMGIVAALIVGRIFLEDDDRFRRENVKSQSQKPSRQSLYSLESGTDTIRSRRSHRGSREGITDYDDDEDMHGHQPQLSPKPMTPRRVKRRSVMTRGTSSHNLGGSADNGSSTTRSSRRHSGGNGRSSTRSSRRKVQHQNPVTKLMDQQQSSAGAIGGPSSSRYTHMPPSLTASNLKSLNQSSDPIYYNMSNSHSNLQKHMGGGYAGNSAAPYQSVPIGHYNPTYQHSTPNLINQHHQEQIDELYNRPPSVRSSYSNFHGARSVNALNNLTGAVDPTVVPQVPQRRPVMSGGGGGGISGVSSHTGADLINNDKFLNSAPPAYNYLNYHTPPDSETTM